MSHFVLYNTFLECCNPRFLNKTEIKIIKIQSPGHNAYTSNNKSSRCLWSNYMSVTYDQTIRTKQSLLASRRFYKKVIL